ncbi:MAG: SEC-C domain-containing protein, partial [bacterium]|nr:SEC-C domain-containing protein [bacterium]
MKTIGRNAPCPCGSGKKYKLCCLPKEQHHDAKEFVWRKLRQTSDKFATRLTKYAFERFGSTFIEDAWEEYILDFDKEYSEDSYENQLFMPWALYSWLLGPDDDDISEEEDWDYMTIAECFLSEHYHELSAMERQFIELTVNQPYTFYQVIDCNPGYGFRLKDLLTETELDVIEKSGSQNVPKGCVLFSQVIQYENVGMAIGTAPVIIPPAYITNIIELRKIIREHEGSVESDDLLLLEDTIRSLYLSIHEKMFTPPKLMNTDGDPLMLHDIYYEIDSPQNVFDKLKVLAVGTEEDELLADAKFDKKGSLTKIE